MIDSVEFPSLEAKMIRFRGRNLNHAQAFGSGKRADLSTQFHLPGARRIVGRGLFFDSMEHSRPLGKDGQVGNPGEDRFERRIEIVDDFDSHRRNIKRSRRRLDESSAS
jgi:hypothetical protein